ncbi:MAG: fumarylacetoacetate hydrolase family protein [Sphingomonadales bacterium]|nr:fumarylacetoacetate hydrolase family protein [Sphingomonadales bacterium]
MKIICIGRNYAEHARELNNEVPAEPIVFMKPESALIRDGKPFFLPDHPRDVHHELEIVLRVGRNGKHIAERFASTYIDRIGLGIDFTARTLQSELKSRGLPWELAKGFDGSAILGDWLTPEELGWPRLLSLRLEVNGEIRQSGDTGQLLFSFERIISFVSRYFTLKTGDLIYTGTPAGVGPVQRGDRLQGYLNERLMLQCKVC